MDGDEAPRRTYCGRAFSDGDLDDIRELIEANPDGNRAQLSRLVCDRLAWFRPDGRRKEMSCRVAMLRMERDGLLVLPPPLKGNGNGRIRPPLTSVSEPKEVISESVGLLDPLSIRIVETRADSRLWNELIERHHYLGYKPLAGAQARYLVSSGSNLLAVLGFSAAAWSLAARDAWIGWNRYERMRNLCLVVNNSRFLILPWVKSRNLASRVLAKSARRLRQDWMSLYGIRPVLLETFVECGRFSGTCYRAANWIHIGRTRGRGKLDRENRYALPLKDVLVYPLDRQFRRILRSPEDHGRG